jgi:ribose-phosphate pyrophosphokinase
MEATNRKRLMLFSGSANPQLAQEVADLLDVELGGVELHTFADGEISVRYTQSVRGAAASCPGHNEPIASTLEH